MKMRYQFLFPTLAAVSLIISLFGGFLIQSSFKAQLDAQRQRIGEQILQLKYATQSAYANYALQNINIDDEALEALARTRQADVQLTRTDEAFPGRAWLENKVLYAESLLTIADRNYCLRICVDIAEVYHQRTYLIRCYFLAYLGSIFAVGGLLLMLVNRITKPLAVLARASDALSGGKLESRASIGGSSELCALAASFNRMADALTEQMARQERFIQALTHEMKTPLTAIIGHADTLRSGKLSAEDCLTTANTILREGKRLDALSGKMTEWILLKHDPPKLRELSTLLLLSNAADAFSGLQTGRCVRISPDAQNAVIWADPALMGAMLANLVRNALNAGSTEVLLGCCQIDTRTVRLVVSDNGCGMDPAELARITEPFYRIDKARSRANGGVGLGLALCKEIAQLHGASLRFESAPGQGTRVTIDLAGKRTDPEP